MNRQDFEQPATGCQQTRVREFLDSDHYHLDDAELMAHLDGCSTCREYMESQAGDDLQWDQATKLLQPTDLDQAGSAEYSAATCCGVLLNQPTAVREVLESLVPSEDPHHLGRLGTYEITGVVGVGGMGVVLKAIDPSLDRVVAVKVMNPRLANNENARRRFAREAKAAAAVLHPNVIPIHSVSSGVSLPYLVMSYIRGGSLQKRLEQDGPLPLIEVLRIGSQIAAGLQAAHEQGLVHRDIKPENILLEEGVERVTITDFGLARAVDDNTITQLGSIAGTPQYMSPEQARGEQLDQQSDLFSLGSVLYALCTGDPPYRDDTSYGVMRKIIDEDPTSIDRLNSEIPLWMVAIIETLMSKPKAERFTTAKEVHDLLDACLSHVQQPAGNPLPLNLHKKTSIIPWSKKMKFIFGSAVSLLAILSAFVGQAMYSQNSAQADREVRAPLSDLDGYIESMMNSPHRMVFLNVSDIGEDENYLALKPSIDGVLMSFPAFDMTYWSRRQGRYVAALKKVAESKSLLPVETSKMSADGGVSGVNFEYQIAGDPAQVADTIKQIIVETFQVDDSEQCQFQYSNMPSEFSVRKGEEPKRVTSAEFIEAAKNGDRVYLGEQEEKIYLIPTALMPSEQVQWNQQIWFTDLRDLSTDERHAIRRGNIQSIDQAETDPTTKNNNEGTEIVPAQ